MSIHPYINRICTHKLKLATLHELQTVYSGDDIMDMIEMMDAHDYAASVYHREEERNTKRK